MKLNILMLVVLMSFGITLSSCAQERPYNNDDFQVTKAQVTHHSDLSISVWEIDVKGTAGKTTPTPNGALDGAPVLGYVFPTSLKPTDVGFSATEGIVAMALTSHPDFDDTPIWDENNDADFANDGIIWHPHWVVLHEDKRVAGGLAVKQFTKADNVTLPPTNPGMPMYMDSPGFPVTTQGNTIKVVVPDYRMNNQTSFKYDGVAAYMIVNTSKEDKPMLGVYDVFSVASGDLSLPYTVKK
ncbi:hypothetical protein D1816_12325 [Aquimarina sp. AD10]|uniref:Uncharacterized protein n=1 Tax=Aquimarina aggregata TaxID=1642818 RepID=A0A162YKM4_9FLAO|nr:MULTISPECIES: hypothetical protein [Aquimarina]AXT61100.1 hypothetical protein D1816_12325 [Aquimarina sp. AD10]KZS39198.1 hypothetical protein AWE51_11630 [Aquimarina aggregata]RKM92155.1 hypothetical protein D7033_21310 [Aquimarina sp. AD10]